MIKTEGRYIKSDPSLPIVNSRLPEKINISSRWRHQISLHGPIQQLQQCESIAIG